MVYLIRHTTPDIKKGICYGQSDINVNASFDKEALDVLQKIPTEFNSKVFCSPLKRCAKLARALFPYDSIVMEERIMEINAGDWELKPWTEINPLELKYWHRNFSIKGIPGGESHIELFERVLDFWSELDLENENYQLVTHDGVIRCILVHLLEMPLSKAFALKLNYGVVVKINFCSKMGLEVDFLK